MGRMIEIKTRGRGVRKLKKNPHRSRKSKTKKRRVKRALRRNPSKPRISARFSVRADGKGIAFFKSRQDAFAYARALHRAEPKKTISVEK